MPHLPRLRELIDAVHGPDRSWTLLLLRGVRTRVVPQRVSAAARLGIPVVDVGRELPPDPPMTDFASIQQGLWDRFIDRLDRAGQDSCIADVPVPALAIDLPPGRLFGQLTR